MMRKPLLISLLLTAVFSLNLAGHASVARLNDVNVASGQNGSTAVTLRVNGAFTHNEYRPTDALLLVDLVGVAPSQWNDRSRELQAPGVKSWRVSGFNGASSEPVTRFELALLAHAQVRIQDGREGLMILVAPAGEPPASAGTGGSTQSHVLAEGDRRLASSPAAGIARVKTIQFTQNAAALDVDISLSAPVTPQAFRLDSPDRIVVDLPNTVPAGAARTMAVNALGVSEVRTAPLQSDPPITRVVLDLTAKCDYDLQQDGGRLTVKVRPAAQPANPRLLQAKANIPAGASPNPATQPASPSPAVKSAASPKPNPSTAPAAAAPASPSPRSAPPASGKLDATQAKVTIAALENSAAPAAGAANLVVAQPAITEHKADKLPDDTTSAPASATPVATTGAPPAQAAPTQKAVNFAAEQQQQGIESGVAPERHYTGEPISVNLKDVDLKDFFRLIHEISGLNVVLDPNVSGSLTLVLDDVPWDQALDIVLKNNSLDRQLEGNVLRIATRETLRQEAEARRHQADAQMLAADKITATRFLSYAHAKDVLPTIKKLLSVRGDVVADDRTNALIITDVPGMIQPIDTLLAKLDRKTMEVEIEARVVAATRTFARDIGTQLGLGWANAATTVGGASAAGTSPITGPIPPGNLFVPPLNAMGQAAIPLFSNLAAVAPTSGLSLLNIGNAYRVDAIITAAESRGLLKVLSRPRIITQSNVAGVIKQGSRIPITTLGQLGGPPTVSYVEAVLRLTVTPQITVESTVFLNVDIENTTPDFSNEIQGNPVFLTQQATTQVLVANGGTVVIGGVIQSQNSLNTQQIPLLGSIPGLGNLFKRRTVSTSTQELIFFITPRIVET